MSKIWKILLPYWWQLLLLLGGLVLQVNSNLRLPEIMARIIDQGITRQNMDIVWSSGAEMLIIVVIGAAGMITASFFAARISSNFSAKLRDQIYKHVLNFTIVEIDQFSTASLLTRSTNDINQLQSALSTTLRIALQSPIMAIGAISMAINTAPSMAWIIALIVAVLIIIAVIVISLVVPKFKIIQTLNDKLNLVARENLTGLRVVRAFNNEKYEEDKFSDINGRLTRTHISTGRIIAIMNPLVQFTISGAALLIVWVGSHLVKDTIIGLGEIVAFMQYATQVMISFMFIAIAFVILPRAIVSIKRINEVLSTKPSVRFKNDGRDVTPPRHPAAPSEGRSQDPVNSTEGASDIPAVEFREVSFAYRDADQPVLKKLNFTVEKGQTTAIIGSTGSGKSTLINLISRAHDATAGEILIDGINIKEFPKQTLMSKIGLVPQKATLFSGTIKSNLIFGRKNASMKDIIAATQISHAYNFIMKQENDFAHHVAQGGKNFSGGQKQRLCIARAIIKNPEIYIFDDSFSALDYKTDLAVRQNLSAITKNTAVIIVAQRISTIKHADKILVLDNGKIVGTGTHDELIKTCTIYKEIATSQLSTKELS